MTHTDILKYALALGEGKDIYDKTHNICYIPDVDINGKWLGIFTIFYDRYSSYYSFNYKNKPEQDEITQNLIDFVIDYIEANNNAEYEIQEYFPEIVANVEKGKYI